MAVHGEDPNRLRFGDGTEIEIKPHLDEYAVTRFRELRYEMSHREAFEVTNDYVLSVLLDCYRVHQENEPAPFDRERQAFSGKLVADGGQRRPTESIRVALYAAQKGDWDRTEGALLEALSAVRQERAKAMQEGTA